MPAGRGGEIKRRSVGQEVLDYNISYNSICFAKQIFCWKGGERLREMWRQSIFKLYIIIISYHILRMMWRAGKYFKIIYYNHIISL